jgi:ABC-type dipeptide/oligopeptide/nickel transport system ATPase component
VNVSLGEPLLSVRNLTVDYFRSHQPLTAVKDVSFEVNKGKCLAIVGESGCGKSTIALSIIGLLPKHESRISSGEIRLDGFNLLAYGDEEWRKVRGKKIAMIFQDPFSSLNPVLTIRYQLEEIFAGNLEELLGKVQLSDPGRILHSYPHQLSGGQRQRVMIAMALSQNPELLIADEPTTALDVTVQDEIIKLLKNLQREMGMSMIFVTHNLGLVKNIADDVAVMRAGVIVEAGPSAQVLTNPTHPYSRGLLRCMPTLKRSQGPLPTLEEAL